MATKITKDYKLKLNTGNEIPVIGLGTFLSKPGEIGPAIEAAIDAGYRHIDCAAAYDNEKEIGETLAKIWKAGKVKREEVFITSKLKALNMRPEEIQQQCEKTLKDLQLDYLDLYLVHHPVAVQGGDKNVPLHAGFGLQDVWRKMEDLYNQKKVKAIGVSNYPTILLNDCLAFAKVKPSVNQIERHPYLTHPGLTEFCKQYKVLITAYSPLGAPGNEDTDESKPKVIEDETIKKMAQKYHKSEAQLLIRWNIQSGVVTIPKSIKAERIKENFDVFDFEISDEDFKALNKLNEELRYFDQDWMSKKIYST